jgi:serine protease Do
MALHVAKALIAHGKVERGWMGVSVQDLTPELAKSAHVETLKGALIAEVVKGGPADKAGLRKNDVVIAYRGKEILDSGTLRNDVATTPIGQEVKVIILQNGKKQELSVKIGNLEEATKIFAASIKDRLGGKVRSLTPKEAEKYGLEANRGIIITSITPKGPLGEVGFEVGDIILEVNGQTIGSLESFVQLVASLKPNQQITLLALDHRSGNTAYVQVLVR